MRTLTITGENLASADEAELGQTTLFDEPYVPNSERDERLGHALNNIREH
jgi:hypothetical protein